MAEQYFFMSTDAAKCTLNIRRKCTLNSQENALISLQGIDKTQFPCNAKSYYMFFFEQRAFTIEAFFFKFLHELSAFENLGTNRPFQRGTCSGFEFKSDFKVSKSGFKKVNDRKEKVWSFC